MTGSNKNNIAIWIITPNGRALADKIAPQLDDVQLFVSERLMEPGSDCLPFNSLPDAVKTQFKHFSGHIFIMSVGIVVRVIAPLIQSKATDPAVVTIDDQGKHAISLLSGHIGGANKLTQNIAGIIAADPVITTATDVNNVPAIDVLAVENQLVIENVPAIRIVNMALLRQKKIHVHDPFGRLTGCLPNSVNWRQDDTDNQRLLNLAATGEAVVWVDDVMRDFPENILKLRPASLVAGIGCNRNTAMKEIKELLDDVLKKFNLSQSSLKCIASIDLKADEAGLIALSGVLAVPLTFFNHDELNHVSGVKNPSPMAEKHIGVKSVCEAAAILASRGGALIVPKHKTQNATLAIARIAFTS
jgi:cobalt-precorrin 5A hydrolase